MIPLQQIYNTKTRWLILPIIFLISLELFFLWNRTYYLDASLSSATIRSTTSTLDQHINVGPRVPLKLPVPAPSPEATRMIHKRMERITSVCAAKKNPTFDYHQSFYFPELRITWFPIYKASSTTWKEFLIDTLLGPDASYKGEHYAYQLLNSYKLQSYRSVVGGGGRKRVWKKEPSTSIRFAVIRHPLARLVSHYRNKLVGPGIKTRGNDMWLKPALIFSRQKSSWSRRTRLRFENELDQVIHNNTVRILSPDNPYTQSFLTFPELVRFILYDRSVPQFLYMNIHWTPAAQRLDICQNNLDIVIKLENEELELPYLLNRLNLTQYYSRLAKKANASAKGSIVKVDQVMEHMKLLSKEEQRQLNEMFAIDYEMFGYEPVFA